MPGRPSKRKPATKEIYRDASTQTSPDRREIEIIELREALSEAVNKISQQLKLSDPGNTKSGKKCKCKGKCNKNTCGCVKRNVPCSKFCECNTSRCENQDPDKENNGQIKLSTDERPSDEMTKQKSLSPFHTNRNRRAVLWDIHGRESKSPVRNNVNKQDDGKLNEQESSTQKTPSPKIVEKLEDFDSELEFSSIDPMKPTRQLPRTPTRVSSPRYQLQQSEASVSTSEQDSAKSSTSPTDEVICVGSRMTVGGSTPHRRSRSSDIGIDAPVVDWEKHCAQLLPCKLCRRKFYPHRLAKHEASCKKL